MPGVRVHQIGLWLFGRLRRIVVKGSSMTPVVDPGDHLLVDTGTAARAAVGVGDVVVSAHPYVRDLLVVKRVIRIDEADRLFLRGENSAESTDSRSYGAVSRETLFGAVVCRLAGS